MELPKTIPRATINDPSQERDAESFGSVPCLGSSGIGCWWGYEVFQEFLRSLGGVDAGAPEPVIQMALWSSRMPLSTLFGYECNKVTARTKSCELTHEPQETADRREIECRPRRLRARQSRTPEQLRVSLHLAQGRTCNPWKTAAQRAGASEPTPQV